MKRILIPPIPHLWMVEQDEYHLLLSHLVENEAYFDFYRTLAENGKYLILDNSAHEFQTGQSIEVLLQQAESLGAKEVVLPDKLFDGPGTFERSRQALLYATRDWPWRLPDRFMVVPQGETYREWSLCLARLVDSFFTIKSRYHHSVVNGPVIGISKDYHEMFDGGLFRILEEQVFPFASSYPSVQIHLLGWPKTLWDLGEIARRFGDRIRSTDSARPYTYGMHGIRLDPTKPAPKYPGRPDDFFSRKIIKPNHAVMRHNVEVYTRLVAGERFREEVVRDPGLRRLQDLPVS